MKKTKIIIIIIVLLFLIAAFPSNDKKIISEAEGIENVTHVTGATDASEKAEIYTVNTSVPETAKMFISKARPEGYTDLDNEESICLYYDDHCVLIYLGEDEKTYVQFSSRKYISQNGFGNLYRPRNRNIIIFYDTWYGRTKYAKDDYKRYEGRYSKSASNNKNIANTVPAPSTHVNNKTNTTKISTGQNESTKIKTSSTKSNSTSNNSTSTNNSSSWSSLKSSSVKTGSTGTRVSSGGGTSGGK